MNPLTDCAFPSNYKRSNFSKKLQIYAQKKQKTGKPVFCVHLN
ncbi:hypothetical protein HMPREF1128_0343 [Haemophilus sputorum HK 2154]|nr:hypothetical protein HMPREF1128_0343 [Haemophilus sputorum HK 2154]